RTRRDAAARRAPALQVPVVRGHGALHAARRAHLQGDGSRRPGGGPAVRWNSGGSHGRASAHFQSIRTCRQQLGRRDVRSREQGFDALNVLLLLRLTPQIGLGLTSRKLVLSGPTTLLVSWRPRPWRWLERDHQRPASIARGSWRQWVAARSSGHGREDELAR